MQSRRRLALLIAWTGAAVFTASLVWFVYCYVVRFGHPASPGRTLAPVLVNVLLFTVFALHHSVLARSGPKHAIRRIVPAELERSIYAWVASLLFLGVCTWWRQVPGVLYALDGPWRLLAWALQIAAILLTIRASSALDVLDLAGVRPVLSAPDQTSVGGGSAPLTTRGLYGFVRHPLYFAWALFVFSTPTMTGTRASFAVISTAYLMMAIPWEERGLIAAYGQEYEGYRRRVRTRMIPWVY